MSSKALYSIARPFLFALDPERAHELTLASLRHLAATGIAAKLPRPAADERTVMGLLFPNPVGLAAGLDKNGSCIDGLAAIGFGFIEVGTVTPRPQPGNPRPRIFRLPEAEALINRLGFNNHGVEAFVDNVRASRFRQDSKGVLGLNIGKNADTPIERAAEDYLYCLEKVYPLADYVSVNISSPNTKNLRQLQEAAEIDALLAKLKDAQQRLADRHARYVPIALKIAPDLDEAQIAAMADALIRHRMDGVIATNTTVSRDSVRQCRRANETGGLSGRPVFGPSNRVIRALKSHLGEEIPIIGVGGILSGDDAVAKIEAGASLIQVYTGLIYKGPALVTECAHALRMRSANSASPD